MENYEEVRVNLTNTQLNKLKAAAKIKTGTMIRITKKKTFKTKKCHLKLSLTTRQKTKTRNVSTMNMSTDIKLSKAQLSKVVQSGGSLGKMLCNMMGNLCKNH